MLTGKDPTPSGVWQALIYFLTTRKAQYTIRRYLRSPRGAKLVGRIVPVAYDELFRRLRYPAGTYIFSDVERLTPHGANLIASVWDRIEAQGDCRLLNHPVRTMRRYELLRTLYDRGINGFNIFRPSELGPEGVDPASLRYPVFIRGENDHKGAQTSLLTNEQQLISALRRLRWRWRGWRPKVITEFCDVSDNQGLYRKYAAFKVGDRVMTRHVFFATHWLVKAWQVLDEPLLAEERQYVENGPHEEELREIFDLARVDFGRIDYGLCDGRVQVWEINSNPQLPVDFGGGGPAREPLHEAFNRKFIDSLTEIDLGAESLRSMAA